MAKYNPFNPNSVVAPNLFAGRALQINDICKKLSQVKHGMPSSFFIFGEKGIGKTALSKLIKYISSIEDKDLHELNFLTSYYSVEKGQTINSVLQASINGLTEQMDKTLVNAIGDRVGKLFNNGKFEIGAFGVSFGITTQEDIAQQEISIKDQAVSILSNVIKSINKTEEKPKDGILVIIDEIHNIANIQNCASILRNIVTSLDVEGLGKISFLVIGYKEDMEKFFSIDTSARRTFDLTELKVMPIDEASEILKRGFKEVGVNWDETNFEKYLTVTGGYPHSVQMIGHNLIEEDTDNNIDEKDWMNVISKTAIQLQEKDFASMYTFKKPHSERDRVLVFLAENEEPVNKKELISKKITSNMYRSLIDLKNLGAIKEDDNEDIYLHSNLFRTAILFDLAVRRYLKVKDTK